MEIIESYECEYDQECYCKSNEICLVMNALDLICVWEVETGG